MKNKKYKAIYLQKRVVNILFRFCELEKKELTLPILTNTLLLRYLLQQTKEKTLIEDINSTLRELEREEKCTC